MRILTAAGLAQTFGARDLFADVDVELNARERVGLVGPNGVGKTTLLQILAGLLEPTRGSIEYAPDLSVGYLRQEAVLTFAGQDNTVYEEMLSVFAPLTAMEASLRDMEARMAEGQLTDELFETYGALQEQYEHGGGYAFRTEIKLVLLGLGFSEEMWEMSLAHLSGGQKTRLLLGRLLLEKPDLLILDEPTNHLDVAAVEWLETILRRWSGTLLIVSHDRYFLDNVVTHVWDMRPAGVTRYRGNYSSYVVQRQQAWEREQALFAAEKARLDREMAFIRKHIAGQLRDMARGKLKRLTRDIVIMETVGVMGMQNKSWIEIGGRVRPFSPNEAARRLNDLTAPNLAPPRLKIKLKAEGRADKIVVHTEELTVGYPDLPLATTPALKVERGQRIAMIGPNGCGKSTLLKTLLGEVTPLKGRIWWGEHVQIGYFAQAHDQLDPARRVIDALIDRAPMSQEKARRYLASYLFRGHDVFKTVADLSGGERGRLALAILAAEGANVLLLDEPTNHLDIPSQEVLQSVLEGFDGTLIFVTHDRYLINRLAKHIWAFRDGTLSLFEGSYDAFTGRAPVTREPSPLDMPAPDPETLDWIKEAAPEADAAVAVDAADEDAVPLPPREWRRRVGQLERELDELELEVSQLEMVRDDLLAFDPSADVSEVEAELAEAQSRLDALNATWDELMAT